MGSYLSILDKLRAYLNELGSVLVCYSGGTDSTFLLGAAYQTVGLKTQAVLFKTPFMPEWAYKDAYNIATRRYALMPFHQITLDVDDTQHLTNNPEDRCYLCKRLMLGHAVELGKELNVGAVIDASQADDLSSRCTSGNAASELGVRSPLQELGFSKEHIRELSRIMQLPTWNKSPYSCLMTRFPQGEHITRDKLNLIETTEEFLYGLGFSRVKAKYDNGRINVELLDRLKDGEAESVGDAISYKMKEFGYAGASLYVRDFCGNVVLYKVLY